MMETILVLDDDQMNLKTIATVLRRYGHNVLETATAQEAIQICKDYTGAIHLFLTDEVLSDKSGMKVAQEVLKSRPDMLVLLVSGYPPEDWCDPDGRDFFRLQSPRIDFLEKPFTPSDLEQRIRKLLDNRSQSIKAGASPS